MKITVDNAAELFEELLDQNSPTKIAVDKKTKVEYWFDPKESCIFGYLRGNVKSQVSEYAIKNHEYFKHVMKNLSNLPNIRFEI